MKILLIDNYDSFVYNVVGLLQRCGQEYPELEYDVIKNNTITLADTDRYDAIILSPGPGIPSEAGELLKVIDHCRTTHPILGICLGCQAIGELFGCRLLHLNKPRHGHSSPLLNVDSNDPIVGFCHHGNAQVGRYHSWVIDEITLTPELPLKITSRDEEGNIMSVSHTALPIFGVQFHPESIITNCGKQMLLNFLRVATLARRSAGK